MVGRLLARWTRRDRAPETAPAPPVPAAPPAPLPRPRVLEHHWLTVLVVRPGPADPLPVPGARLVLRPFPRGASRPGEVVARITTGPDGTAAVQLPEGRYAVAARQGPDSCCVTVTLEHPGRAVLALSPTTERVALSVDVVFSDGKAAPEATIEVRSVHGGALAARGTADAKGACVLHVPRGAYEVRAGRALARTYVEADTSLRLVIPEVSAEEDYLERARAAAVVGEVFDVRRRSGEDAWN